MPSARPVRPSCAMPLFAISIMAMIALALACDHHGDPERRAVVAPQTFHLPLHGAAASSHDDSIHHGGQNGLFGTLGSSPILSKSSVGSTTTPGGSSFDAPSHPRFNQPLRMAINLDNLVDDPYTCYKAGQRLAVQGGKDVMTCRESDVLSAEKRSFLVNLINEAAQFYHGM